MISATWCNYRSIYIPEYSQCWFQNAVLNLITTRREFTLFQYSKTLSSIITSFWIIFNICYMMKQQYYIYIAEYSQYWFLNAVLNLITTRREFTLFQYSKTLSNIITSFWVIFNICYMMKQQYYIYIAEYSQYWFQNAVLNLITTRRNLLFFSILKHSRA